MPNPAVMWMVHAAQQQVHAAYQQGLEQGRRESAIALMNAALQLPGRN
jgi:hypothetical protein